GCGKSTCIRLLMKELGPSSGSVLIAGRDLAEVNAKRLPYLRRNIGVIFQDYKLLPNRTVYANVAYALEVIGESRAQIRRKVPDILHLVGLSTKLHAYPDELSGGEQQRVSIARAFVNHPPLLLCDEPTGNLDPETSIGIMQLIYRINRTGTTVLVATHDREMLDKMRRRVVLNVYLADNITQPQLTALRNRLNTTANVKSVNYISKQQALNELQAQRKGTSDAIQLLGSNPLPATYRVVPKDPGQVQDI